MIAIKSIDLRGLGVLNKFFMTIFKFSLKLIDNTKLEFTLGSGAV